MRFDQLLIFFKFSTVFGNSGYSFGISFPNSEISTELLVRKKSENDILKKLNSDLTIWINQNFSSGIAKKKISKYFRKVQKMQNRFENLYEKCGFYTKKGKNKKDGKSKRSIFVNYRKRRGVDTILQNISNIFKGKHFTSKSFYTHLSSTPLLTSSLLFLMG